MWFSTWTMQVYHFIALLRQTIATAGLRLRDGSGLSIRFGVGGNDAGKLHRCDTERLCQLGDVPSRRLPPATLPKVNGGRRDADLACQLAHREPLGHPVSFQEGHKSLIPLPRWPTIFVGSFVSHVGTLSAGLSLSSIKLVL